ncbi:MAG: SRPBCC family protein, partial [Actinomycetota bacterium]
MSTDKIISITKFVPAPPQAIFDLLADPRKHNLIDGSGSVQAARMDAPDRLSLGAKFGMDMKIGLKYRITNEVVEFDEPRRIGWRHMGGHIWRYIVEPAEGGSQVTEQFDWNQNRAPLMLKLMNAQSKNKKSIEATLDRLAAHF